MWQQSPHVGEDRKERTQRTVSFLTKPRLLTKPHSLDFSATQPIKHLYCLSLFTLRFYCSPGFFHLQDSQSPQKCQQELHPFFIWITFPDKWDFLWGVGGSGGTYCGLLPSGCAAERQKNRTSLWQLPTSEPISWSWLFLSVLTFLLEWFAINKVLATLNS